MTGPELIQRVLMLEKLQNRLVQQVSNDVNQLASAVRALQAEHTQIKSAVVQLSAAVQALLSRPAQASAPSVGPVQHQPGGLIMDPAPSLIKDRVSATGTPLADLSEEDAEIMLTGGEDG